MLVGSERETQRMQYQVDEAREQSSKELSALRLQLQSKHIELEKHSRTAMECQKEVWKET